MESYNTSIFRRENWAKSSRECFFSHDFRFVYFTGFKIYPMYCTDVMAVRFLPFIKSPSQTMTEKKDFSLPVCAKPQA